MNFNEPDMAGFAEGAALLALPGTTWKYANGNPAILARIVRDRVGGRAVDVLRFARRELFGPLGMRAATLELDSTGTPIAGAFLFATPRDWARFGLLFLEDGVVGGTRILPEGWVRYSTTPTASAGVGYGAGWWINEGDSQGARFRRDHGMPAEAFMALGIYGQTVVVVPSQRLVIARFGTTYDLRDGHDRHLPAHRRHDRRPARAVAYRRRRCSTSRQRFCTTWMPAFAQVSAASSWWMPSWSQTTRGRAARMSCTCGGMSRGRRNTLTISTGAGTALTVR